MDSKKDYSTYRTDIAPDKEQTEVLNAFMQQWLDYQTRRYADLKKKGALGQYDKNDCDAYRKNQTFTNTNKQVVEKFDARYARAIDIDIQSRAEASLECKALEIDDKTVKLEKAVKRKNKLLNKYKNRKANPYIDNQEGDNKAYRAYRFALEKVQKLEAKIAHLEKDIEQQRVKIVFGGKALFHKQFQQGVDFQAWQKEWANRGDRFECGGSKSEEYGNRKFHLTFAKDYDPDSGKRPRFDLRIILPAFLQEAYGKELVLRNIVFYHGQSIIAENVKRHTNYKKALCDYKKHQQHIKKITDEDVKAQALNELGKAPEADDYGVTSFAFQVLRKNGKFYVHVSVPRQAAPVKTHDKNGVIGVDINYDNIAYSNVSKQGDLIDSKVLRFNFGPNNSSVHREQMLNQHLKALVQEALKKKKHIVVEYLDFTHKKSQQEKGLNKEMNRMLHSLAYRKIKERLRILCLEQGVVYKEVNPAYTSLLGKCLYTKQYGISAHQAAAFVIGRRHLNHQERFHSKNLAFIYKDKACYLEIPERIFKEQDKLKPFQFWYKINRWMATEFKAPSRFYKPPLNSDSSPAC